MPRCPIRGVMFQAHDEFARVQAALTDSQDQMAKAREEVSRAQESERRIGGGVPSASASSATGTSRILYSVRS